MKVSSANATPLDENMMKGVSEIEPWGIFEQTAWSYVKTMVEEEVRSAVWVNNQERRKLIQKNVKSEQLKKVQFSYQNRKSKKLMVPVTIVNNNNLHDFFTIFISGVTGIPTGFSLHKPPNLRNTPLIRVVRSVFGGLLQDQYLIPLLKYAYQKLIDSIIRVLNCFAALIASTITFENKKNTWNLRRKSIKLTITHFSKPITGFFPLWKSHFRKKFAREARWENWKERIFYVLEFFHISNQSYVEEYEEYVTQYVKQRTRQSSKTQKQTAANSHDYYSLLGVDRTASQEEIMRNFRVKIMKVHPDYYQYLWFCDGTHSGADAQERTQELIEAYQTLRNPEKRYKYDLTLH